LATLEELNKQLAQLKAQRAVKRARAQREAKGGIDPSIDPTAEMGTLERLAVGNTAGFRRGAAGLTNLALPDSLTPKWASDDALRGYDQQDKALKDTTAGGIGSLIGEVASTLPVGGGAGTTAKLGGSVLKRTLASLPVRGAVEGAITSAATASPDNQGGAAGVGATLGGGLGVAGKVVGRLGRGLAQRSNEAENLAFAAAQHGEKPFIPLSQAVGDDADTLSRLTRTLYKDALPYVPGVSGQLKSQGKKLGDSFRRTAMKEADSVGPNKVLTPGLLANPEAAIPKLRAAVTKGFDDSVGARSYTLPIPSVREAMIRGQLRRAFPHIDDTTVKKTVEAALEEMDRFSSGKNSIHGKNLLNAKNAISDRIGAASGIEKAALMEVDNMIKTQIERQTPADVFEAYKRAQNAHMDVLGLEKAFKRADDTFSPSVLRRSTNPKAGNRQIARTFDRVLKNSVGTPSAEGRRLGQIATGVAGVANLPLTLLAVGGANVAARPGVQNALMGQTAMQQYLVRALQKNPDLRRFGGSAARAALTTQVD
jgi:hypothetical protein